MRVSREQREREAIEAGEWYDRHPLTDDDEELGRAIAAVEQRMRAEREAEGRAKTKREQRSRGRKRSC